MPIALYFTFNDATRKHRFSTIPSAIKNSFFFVSLS